MLLSLSKRTALEAEKQVLIWDIQYVKDNCYKCKNTAIYRTCWQHAMFPFQLGCLNSFINHSWMQNVIKIQSQLDSQVHYVVPIPFWGWITLCACGYNRDHSIQHAQGINGLSWGLMSRWMLMVAAVGGTSTHGLWSGLLASRILVNYWTIVQCLGSDDRYGAGDVTSAWRVYYVKEIREILCQV